MSIKFDLGSVKESVGSITHAGVAQTKKMTSIARMKTDNMAQKDAIRKAYEAIGKMYYSQHKNCPGEEYADLFAKVDAAMVAIAANDAAIADMKADKEVVIDVELKDEEDSAEDTAAEAEETPSDETAEPAEDAAAEDVDAPSEEDPAGSTEE